MPKSKRKKSKKRKAPLLKKRKKPASKRVTRPGRSKKKKPRPSKKPPTKKQSKTKKILKKPAIIAPVSEVPAAKPVPEKKVTKKAEAKEKPKKIAKEEKGAEGSMDLGLTPMRIYLNQIEHIPLLTPEREVALAKIIKENPEGSSDAREEMIKSNLRLVINIAKRYANIGLPFSDLVEEGNIGLMRAVDKFDYSKGYRFSTYASWWIKQGMMRALSNQSKMIRIPVHMYESISKWRKTREFFIQRYGKIPTAKDLAKRMKVPLDKIKEIESVLSNPGSLNVPVSLDSTSELIDLIEDQTGARPQDSSHQMLTHERIQSLLSIVSEREKRILIMRFGLMGEDPKTLEEAAQVFGITRERVRQIEEAAIKKISAETKKQQDKMDNYL